MAEFLHVLLSSYEGLMTHNIGVRFLYQSLPFNSADDHAGKNYANSLAWQPFPFPMLNLVLQI